MSVAHDYLVDRAARWLVGRRCVLVLQEANCYGINEFPDAIGWLVNGNSIMVECKMSRSDFHADKRKVSKRSGRPTMGRQRWYLTPEGLLRPKDLPEGCGLLEVAGPKRLRIMHQAANDDRPGCEVAEAPLLVHAARKQAWEAGSKDRRVRLTCIAAFNPDAKGKCTCGVCQRYSAMGGG